MSDVRVHCPNPECQASFSIAPDEASRFRRCPQCGAAPSDLDDPAYDGGPNTRNVWAQPSAGLAEAAALDPVAPPWERPQWSPPATLAGPAGPPGFRSKWSWRWLVPAAFALLAVLGIVVRVVTDTGTVAITGTDESMEVRVDGKIITIDRPGDPIQLRVGSHKLLVTRGDLRVAARSFVVWRGRETPLRVEYAPRDQPQTAEAPKSPAEIVPQPAPMVPTVWTNTIGMTFVRLEPGEFQMGSTPAQIDRLMNQFPSLERERLIQEQPQRRVRITKGFSLGRCEVTQGQYQAVMGMKYGRFQGSDDLPVECISWLEAVTFCNRLSEKEGRPPYYRITEYAATIVGGVGYRLPTEVEWEYACRAGSRGLYGGSDDPESLVRIANVSDASAEKQFRHEPPFDRTYIKGDDGYVYTAPVGRFQANAWGLHDMLGNVWEWCDVVHAKKHDENAPTEDPHNTACAACHVTRGGGWSLGPWYCRPASRISHTSEFGAAYLGFRVAAAQ